MARKLVILLGPTAVGKTDYSLELASRYDSPIISCDSRQIYKEMTIGTAVPDASQLAAVKHYFIQDHSVEDLYTAGLYEQEALSLIGRLFDEGHETLVMTGGSMFYIDAVCKGLDDIPGGSPELRASLLKRLAEEGVESLSEQLRELDPETYDSVDIMNGQRLVRALEVCITTGKPFSSFKTSPLKKRDFEIEKIGLVRPREELYDRINRRVVAMMDRGLLDEVRSLVRFRDLTALQTVGYKECFEYLDGVDGGLSAGLDGGDAAGLADRLTGCRAGGLSDGRGISLDETVAKIQTNTRHYAKKQLTWWKRDPDIRWMEL